MKLGGNAILAAFRNQKWTAYIRGEKVTNLHDIKVQPNSVDVSLHMRLLIPHIKPPHTVLRPWLPVDQLDYEEYLCDEEEYILHPGSFILGSVNERFECKAPLTIYRGHTFSGEELHTQMTFTPKYDGRSTTGRIGLISHLTAGYGDYGFGGAFTLEICNLWESPIALRAGMRIGQITFEDTYDPFEYTGAYSTDHNDGPVVPKLGPGRF